MDQPEAPRPSASIILVSPSNQILLLHRVRTSKSFPSAHVFPGGNLSPEQDGRVPAPDHPSRHEDGKVYRLGAIRECFEESGILLARPEDGAGILEVPDDERMNARKAVHANTVKFMDWVTQQGGIPDTENLIPFTRWITPTTIRRRFTTQMYLYFLPLPKTTSSSQSSSTKGLPIAKEAVIPVPTSDGGIEHTTARFLPPNAWLSQATSGSIILFPPQFFLLSLLSPFLSPGTTPNILSPDELQRQRDGVMEFLMTGNPPWRQKCMSPIALMWKTDDGRAVLGIDKPGPEMEGSGRRGDGERVILVKHTKAGPRNVEVRWKEEVLREARQRSSGVENL